MQVVAGDLISFTASGQVHFGPDQRSTCGPDRSHWLLHPSPISPYGQYPVKNIRAGGLVACIDQVSDCASHRQGRAFAVGAGKSIRAPITGMLHLGINDNLFTDNSGHFDVQVTVSR
jgi:hypothetical protein